MGRRAGSEFPNLLPLPNGRFTPLAAGALAVSCWCEEGYVAMSKADVLAGKTASCGRPDCRPPD